MKFLLLVLVGLVSVSRADRILTFENVQSDLSKVENDDFPTVEGIKAELMNLTPEKLEQIREGISIRFNLITDLLLVGVRRAIVSSGLDPLELPDQTLDGITNAASISLTGGSLYQLSSLARGGDVRLTYTSNDRIALSIPVTFRALVTKYDYSTRVVLSNVNGKLEASVINLKSELEIGLDLVTNNATLYDATSDIEDLSIVFKGNDGTDWLTNALTDLLTPVFKVLVASTVEGAVKIPAQLFVDALNNYLNR